MQFCIYSKIFLYELQTNNPKTFFYQYQIVLTKIPPITRTMQFMDGITSNHRYPLAKNPAMTITNVSFGLITSSTKIASSRQKRQISWSQAVTFQAQGIVHKYFCE